MKVCVATEGLNNPCWSSANFIADGFKELDGIEVYCCKVSDYIPNNMDLYVDIECGHNIILNRKHRPVITLMLDIFDNEIDRKVKFNQAATSDYVTVMADCDRIMLDSIGIKVDGLINWGVHSKIWHKIDCKKQFDAGFIGNTTRKMSRHREEYMKKLRTRFKIEKSEAYMEDNANFISAGKVGLDMPNLGFEGLNQRIGELIGCQLPLLTRNMAGIRDFLPNKLVTFYDGIDDICDKFQEILDNYEERLKNAEKLFNFMEENHSYKAIAKRVLGIVNGEKYDLDYYRSLTKSFNQ